MIAPRCLALFLAFSSAVTVFSQTAPVITDLPASLTVAYGGTINIDAWLNWDRPYTVKWDKDGVVIPYTAGADWVYVKSSVTLADSGRYTVTFTKPDGTVAQATCVITVSAPVAPTITQQPAGLSIEPGANAHFSVSVGGTTDWTYQWYLNGQVVAGAKSAGLTIYHAQPDNYGSYTVVVTNSGGSVTSNAAVLSLVPSPGVVTVKASHDAHSLFGKADGTLWAAGNSKDPRSKLRGI